MNLIDGEFKKLLSKKLSDNLSHIGRCINGGDTAYTKHKSVYKAHCINLPIQEVSNPLGLALGIFESIVKTEYSCIHSRNVDIIFRSLSLSVDGNNYRYYVRFAFDDKDPSETIEDYDAKSSNALYEESK